MYTITALVAVVAACVLARPPAPAVLPTGPAPITHNQADDSPEKTPLAHGPNSLDEYIIPHFLSAPPADDYQDGGLEELYREIGYIDQLGETLNDNLDGGLFMGRPVPAGVRSPLSHYMQRYQQEFKRAEKQNGLTNQPMWLPFTEYEQEAREKTALMSKTRASDQVFAMTPLDAGYFDVVDPELASKIFKETHQDPNATIDPRQIRQNPNLSRTKTLVASNLEKLRIGLANKEYRMPVSLLPANLNWLKIDRPIKVEESSEEPISSQSTDKPDHVFIKDTEIRSTHRGSFYSVALVLIVGSGIAIMVVGFMVGLMKLSKRAKAAADVDYPAYGVTGPTTELTGDRKLAHSAHLYHYQHQKQILALESCNNDQRAASVSEPESEEENEEGDYTVYECPGFATTGDMEVKNPMFTDDQTPATPGKAKITPVTPEKIELTIVKPQPTDEKH